MKRNEEVRFCDTIGALLEPYLDGDLPPEEADRVRSHLACCPACATELALAEAIQRELRSLPQLDCPPEVLTRVRAAGQAEVIPLTPRRQRLPAALTGLAAALVLTIGGLTYRQLGHPAPPPSPAEPSPAEVARATEEARFALAYIGKVNRQALGALSKAAGPFQEAHP
jgi:anti-sigma factor RsiW